jgi:hypothetical protein
MSDDPIDSGHDTFAIRDAARFWEPRRTVYNGILTVIVLLWLVLTWPHFRPAMTWSALVAMLVLAFFANVCYCAAYGAELALQPFVSNSSRKRWRWVLWIAGTLFAIVFENYWIADEIYPDAVNGGPKLFGGMNAVWNSALASNMNFPAPLAVLGFLAAVGGSVVAVAAALIFWFARKPRLARVAGLAVGGGAVIYFGLLLGFSASSHATMLSRGQEKYFCEIDCHLAYSVVDVKSQPEGPFVITLRTRFDETTTSPNRPKDAPLSPSPREVRLIDSAGREYAAVATQGTPLLTPLKPADSYTTELEFNVPKDATGLRLLLNTSPQWPDRFVIGDENSWLHKKTYFAL